MIQADQQEKRKDEQRSTALALSGKDEMNLAEFPFASLRSRGDRRKAIVYDSWITDKDGNRQQQKWIVQGGSLVGLPTEFDERVYVALMAITARYGFESRKVAFSVYKILKIIGESTDKTHYQIVEKSLDRLKGATIKTEGAFWDNEKKELVRTAMAFNLIDKYWLRYREKDERIKEEQGVPAYIIWGEEIWKSFQRNYIKSLDLEFFYSLGSPTARRLFRLLDKRMRSKGTYEFDIFDLASKLGMARYRFPTDIRERLQCAFDELIARGFLASAKVTKSNGYTRIRFIKAAQPPTRKPEEASQGEAEAGSNLKATPPSRPEPLDRAFGARGDDELAAADRKDIEASKRRNAAEEPYSEEIARLVEDLTLQHLHDPDHVNSNITQAENLWRESKLAEEEFIELIQEAKVRTLKHSGGIRKKAGYMGLKNRAPYFFQVLKSLIRDFILQQQKQKMLGAVEERSMSFSR